MPEQNGVMTTSVRHFSSKSKKNSRKATWKRKADTAAQKALSLAKSVLRGQTTSFVYTLTEDEE